ncbi:MAG: carboxypeptidase-like regulatory domain-containing protein, partial [Verrucomicrobia bacterium]|nr:carboxypeptidase-like regulatory domain-containing protein [Verrucomicrobiota bacterium]
DVLVDGGAVGASATGVVLTTSTLRIGNVMPSPDWMTVTIYLRNLDTAPCTINNVFLNTDVTSQCTFVSGTTVAANGVGVIEVPFATARVALTPYAVRIIATKTTSGDKSVAAPVRLLVPWFSIATWSSRMDEPLENGSQVTAANYVGLRNAKDLQIDLNFGDANPGRTKEAIAQWGFQSWKDSVDKNVTPYNYTVGNNGFVDWTDLSTYAWGIGEEMDNGPTSAGNGCSDKVRYANTILQVKYFNKYGWISDIVCQDNYGDATAANANWLKVNCEPTRMVAWTDYDQSGTTAYAITEKFWGQIMYGAKSIYFFKYGGYVPTDGNWFTKTTAYQNRATGARQAVRELSQVRDLVTYSDVSSAVTCPSGTTARLLVGKNRVLVVMIKTSSSGSVSGNLVATMPSWIPISATPDANFNVYRVDQNGMTAQSYTTGSGTVTIPISTVAGDADRIFVVGQPDTVAPGQPLNVAVVDRMATGVANKLTLTWNEPWDDLGVKGYKVYKNGIEEGDVRFPMYDTPVIANPYSSTDTYTVKAYDSAGNHGPESLPVKVALEWNFTQPDPGDQFRPHLDRQAVGWCHDQGSTMRIKDGALEFNNPIGDGSSGRLYSPSALKVPATSINYLKLRMKNETPRSQWDKVYVEFMNTGSGNWYWLGDIPVVPYDTIMRDHVVKLQGAPSGDTIDKLRLNQLGTGLSKIESIKFGMDTTPPTGPTSVSWNGTSPRWVNTSAVTWVWSGCSDDVGLVDTILAARSNPGWQNDYDGTLGSSSGSGSFTWSVTMVEGRDYYLHIAPGDINGYVWPYFGPVSIDQQNPATTASVAGAVVTLNATDTGGSGVAATYYTVDGGAQQTYSAPFTVSGGGTHSVTFSSVDVAGNAEAGNTTNVTVNLLPTVSVNSETICAGGSATLTATTSAS